MNNLFNPAVFFKSNERHELARKIENEIRLSVPLLLAPATQVREEKREMDRMTA